MNVKDSLFKQGMKKYQDDKEKEGIMDLCMSLGSLALGVAAMCIPGGQAAGAAGLANGAKGLAEVRN